MFIQSFSMPSHPEHLHTFKSVYLNNERAVWVRTPSSGKAPRNLVIILDAELYREKVAACETIEELEEAETNPPTIFVFVSAHSIETRAIECPCYPPFVGFMIEELMPWLIREYPEIKDCDQRILVGLSYTGLASAYIALQSPDTFDKIIAQSGSFWWNNCWLVEQYAKLPNRLPVDFYLEVGDKEIRTNVDHGHVLQTVSQVDAVTRFRDVLQNSGHTVIYVEFDGHHDTAKWRETLPGALQWALQR